MAEGLSAAFSKDGLSNMLKERRKQRQGPKEQRREVQNNWKALAAALRGG